jgi:hypothetical protein
MTTIRGAMRAGRAVTRAVAVAVMLATGVPLAHADGPASSLVAPIPSDFEQVAETPSLRLHVNKADSRFIVEDRRSGKQWSSNPIEPLGPQKASQEDALFLLSVTNAKRQMTNLLTWNSEKPQVTISPVAGGFRAVYDVGKFRMRLALEYLLKEDRAPDGHAVPYLEVTIPDKGIEEYGDCSLITSVTCFRIVTLEVLPLFGAARVGQKGYVMIPDGAGAIVDFKPEYPQYRQRYSAQIYGPDAASNFFSAGVVGGRRSSSITRPTMPVWGVKHEDGAYAAIVTKGEFQANVNAYLAGYIMAANRGSAEFIYRRQASIPRRRSVFVNKIEEQRLPGDRQVRYVLLSGEDSDYAGMARAYRDFLMMVRGVKPMSQPVRPLLDLFMGITRLSSFREDFVPTTTFDQALTIIRQFVDKGVKDFDVHLVGWADDGYRGRWPRRYPAESELGGNDGLKALIDAARKLGVNVILEDDYMFGYTFSSGGIIGQIPGLRNIWPNWSYGFNSRWDTVRGVNKLPVFEGSGGIYLLNPVIARNNYLERDLPTHKAIGAAGVNLRQMGAMVMSDTNDRYPLSREQVAETWMKMADREREVLGGAIVSGPNAYVIGRTDRVYDAPVSSLDAFGDVSVPVYHIATQGLVVRHTIRANLRNDPKTELLRQYEWGLQPVYQLTWAPSSDLIRTDYNLLYSSQVDDWLEPATQEYKFMRETFGFLENQMISGHDILSRGFNRVTYADGTRLYVNYNPESRRTPDGAEVRGYGYALERKGSGR